MTSTGTVCVVDYHIDGSLVSAWTGVQTVCVMPNFYQSPSLSGVVKRLENKLLAADDSWWTSRQPLYTRVVAEVPLALYLNFLANKSYVASLSPRLFRPLDLPGNPNATLFTLLFFSLERARPLWAPRTLGALAPRVMQSNWRFYGHITGLGPDSRPGVLFVRTVTTSLLLSAFGRRLARCFPLQRAHRMTLECAARRLIGAIDPGGGSGRNWYLKESKLNRPRLALFSPSNSPLTRTTLAGLLTNICRWWSGQVSTQCKTCTSTF